MKYCEKCGNKLNEGYAFCDKCGTKIEKKEKKVVVKEEEKKIVTPTQVTPIIIKKGKIIFLSIMNILLLASTITFLILWLTKPTKTEYQNYNNNNSNSKKEEQKKEDNQFLGKWEQTLEYKSGNKVVQTIYGSIEFKENHTYKITYYDKSDKENTKEEQNGTYTINDNSVKLEWIEGNERNYETYTLKNNKLCINSDCSSYLVKNGYNSKIVIPIDEEKEKIERIDYSDYNSILNTGKDAIVVIVRNGCVWCEKYESVVDEINKNYTTPVYYYELDSNIDVAGTPSTIIIKNGNVIDLIEGYKEYSVVENILDNLGIK